MGEAHLVRNANELAAVRAADLGKAAVEHLAHEPATGVHGVQKHARPNLPVTNSAADRFDLARHVVSGNDRQVDPNTRHSADREYVMVVERAGANAQEHVLRAEGLRSPIVFDAQVSHPTVGSQ
jgi:hypothetical protein